MWIWAPLFPKLQFFVSNCLYRQSASNFDRHLEWPHHCSAIFGNVVSLRLNTWEEAHNWSPKFQTRHALTLSWSAHGSKHQLTPKPFILNQNVWDKVITRDIWQCLKENASALNNRCMPRCIPWMLFCHCFRFWKIQTGLAIATARYARYYCTLYVRVTCLTGIN